MSFPFDFSEPHTVEEIVDYCIATLNPIQAQKMRSMNYSHLCTTPVITAVRTADGTVPLAFERTKVGGRQVDMFAAIYGRISTESQSRYKKASRVHPGLQGDIKD